jgi:agmatine/peptidylarginine deiminase
MGIFSKIPATSINDLTLQLKIKERLVDRIERRRSFFPSEWFPQSGVQLTWPHTDTDWRDMLEEVTACYIQIAYEISTDEKLLIVCPDTAPVEELLTQKLPQKALANITFFPCPTNDTWARDHAFVTVINESSPELLDFGFNGWGNKFEARLDNAINKHLYSSGLLNGNYNDCLDFILEGGSIESDGEGTVLTTSHCLLNKERNPRMSRADIEEKLKDLLHIQRILWLEHGHLSGDDTDGHIDTLARFCPNNTIAYTQCTDQDDEHYTDLHLMEEELRQMRTLQDTPYDLVPLPLPEPIIADGERLPATYANFLITNHKILVPTYRQSDNDETALKALQDIFPKYEVKGIDCCALIRQHGSLHCSTMQYPVSVIK